MYPVLPQSVSYSHSVDVFMYCLCISFRKVWRERESAKPFDPMSLVERTGMTYVPPAYTKDAVSFIPYYSRFHHDSDVYSIGAFYRLPAPGAFLRLSGFTTLGLQGVLKRIALLHLAGFDL